MGIEVDHQHPIYRRFSSIEEQNNWFNASDKPFFEEYMIPEILENKNENVNANFGYGKLINTGKIDTQVLLKSYKSYLTSKDLLVHEQFNYDSIELEEQSVRYNNIKAKYIVFCEGYGVKKNPYFKNIPLQEAKGELLTIYAPELKIDFLLKSSVFIMPLGNDHYKVGATFNWADKTLFPSESGKKELLTKLKMIINSDFEIVDHVAGIRPTMKDRRPILGKHQKYNQLAILNGLGTRGVMLAPKMAMKLFEHLEFDHPLEKEITIARFYQPI